MPQRIQRMRLKGWRMPPDAIYVGRPSKWGNPFKTDPVRCYEQWLADQWDLLGQLDELRGHDLVCWCPLPLPCHADILLRLAND